jgi:DNA repair exonuclease SbcCD ATPase subunit
LFRLVNQLRTVMNTLNILNIILGFQLTMGLPEFIICVLGALILGFTLHFFWKSKKSLHISDTPPPTGINENDNWKLKYYNDMDMQERAQQQLRERLNELQENEQILTIELEETRKEVDELRLELDEARKELEEAEYRPMPVGEAAPVEQLPIPAGPAADYLSQLRSAQEKLVDHNTSIHRLLQHIELLGEAEKKNQDLQLLNAQLYEQLRNSEQLLSEKEGEIGYLRHQQKMAEEMSLRLDKAYEEYHLLQGKLEKLQHYFTQPVKRGADYEELQGSYYKLGKEHDEIKLRQISLREENQRLSRILADTEEKLKEANFQRLQFQKRTVFLEELNHDLQEISEHNKKIENQLRRVSDMENLLAKVTGPGNDLPNA